jgi:tetratricopeptide (TPR) repeat protein
MGKKSKRQKRDLLAEKLQQKISASDISIFDKSIFVMLLLCHFICPLVFFTDLTRNPYYTQIILLNMCILSTVALVLISNRKNFSSEHILNVKTPIDKAFIVFLLMGFFSWGYSYFLHNSFFRSSIFHEGVRLSVFAVINCFLVFWVSKHIRPKGDSIFDYDLKWVIFLVLWGLLWSGFSQMRGEPTSLNVLSRLLNFYGILLFSFGLWLAWKIVKKGKQEDFLHLAFVVGILASGYGILQSFGIEWIWTKFVNPYGSRPVSTFGNPNFLTSYLIILLPFLWVYFLKTKKTVNKIFYACTFLLYSALLLTSLTRSAWLGAFVGIVFVTFFMMGNFLRARIKAVLSLLAILLVLVLLWPSGVSDRYTSTISERIGETAKLTATDIGLNADEKDVYPSWHQRLLIWSAYSQMGMESPLLGIYTGELFFPFYQGPLLSKYKGIRSLRTHANNAHNQFIEVFAQNGLVGLGLYLWILITLFFYIFRNRNNIPTDDFLYSLAGLGGILALLADNTLNVSLNFAIISFLFWWQVGTISARVSRFANGSMRAKRNLSLNKCFITTLIVLVLFGIFYFFSLWMREVHFFAGYKLLRQNYQEVGKYYLQKAYAWNHASVHNNFDMGNVCMRRQEYDKSIWAYDQALKANAGYDEIYYGKALILSREFNRNDEAVKYLKTAIFINPLNKKYYDLILSIYKMNPSYYKKDAAITIGKALKIFPNDSDIKDYSEYFSFNK